MPALLLVWKLARPLLPYIAAALVVLGLLSAYGHREYGRGKAHEIAKYQPVMDRALANIRTLKANQAVLLAAIARQNAAVDAMKAAGDKRVSDGKAALVAARRANQGLTEQADALRKSAGRKLDGAPCPISETLAKVGEI